MIFGKEMINWMRAAYKKYNKKNDTNEIAHIQSYSCYGSTHTTCSIQLTTLSLYFFRTFENSLQFIGLFEFWYSCAKIHQKPFENRFTDFLDLHSTGRHSILLCFMANSMTYQFLTLIPSALNEFPFHPWFIVKFRCHS